MVSGYFITGITTGNLIRLVKRNGIGLHPRYIGRFFILLLYSLGTSILQLVEKLLYSDTIDKTRCPQNPIFIIGHWRSGTTFLHQIFNALPGFKTPTMLEIGTPESFLVSKKVLSPIIKKLLPSKRSTDNISLNLDEPQEDEFALFRATTHSPVEKLVFPEKDGFFLDRKCDFMPPDTTHATWKSTLITFCKKLSLHGNGRIVLKNPFHSTRIRLLKKIFPKAKFIHIYRNPTKVIPSTIRMWKIEGMHNCLREGKTAPSLENAISVYDTMLSKIKNDLQQLPEQDYCTIRFEDLRTDPVSTLCDALSSIEINLNQEQLQHLSEFTESVKNYRQNKYTLSDEQIEYIKSKLQHHMSCYA
ncbi:MAG: sulfotransferase [Chitinispirillaceae bacterium]|nr:sulfotransferase [Chitinispirillaceae bacterium]